MEESRIAIFASGSGTNAENLIGFFRENPKIKVSLIITNNPKAGVIQRAKNLGVPYTVISKSQLQDEAVVSAILETYNISFIVLAGWLLLVPSYLIETYPSKIINIHPALLPKFGGKGMYGAHVHNAVIQNGETQSGITIHLVNERYDEGKILEQHKIDVQPEWNPEDLQKHIHELEYRHFPKSIERYLKTLINHV